MASRQSLKRIGEEGFRMIDQAEEKQRCLYNPTKPTVHYLHPPQLTKLHKGSTDRDSPALVITRDQVSAGAMDCYEAARRFGGMVLTDFNPKKKEMIHRRNKAF
ncbi:hypothetical protein QQ045_026111 [Rhodiola kirilowii]